MLSRSTEFWHKAAENLFDCWRRSDERTRRTSLPTTDADVQ